MDFQEQITSKTNQELLDIYVNSDDYQTEFVNQAYQELIKRGVSLEKYNAEKENKSRLFKEDLEKGRKGNELYIALGFASAIIGGFISIIAGYIYSQSKRDGPSGTRFYVYDKPTRVKGQIMLTVGCFALLLTLMWKFS